MRHIAGAVTDNTYREIRQAALVCDQVLVTSTPVDTGRARANWIVSLGAPVFTVEASPGAGAATAKALAQGQSAIARWRGVGPIFISNSVPYIEPLDHGHSKQAPAGMTTQAIQAASQHLRNARILRGIA
jgi:hypothetical protein